MDISLRVLLGVRVTWNAYTLSTLVNLILVNKYILIANSLLFGYSNEDKKK